MEKIEAKLRELEEEVIQVKIQMQAKDQGLEQQKKAIVDHMDKEFATHKLVMNEIVEGAKTEFTAQRFNHNNSAQARIAEAKKSLNNLNGSPECIRVASSRAQANAFADMASRCQLNS